MEKESTHKTIPKLLPSLQKSAQGLKEWRAAQGYNGFTPHRLTPCSPQRPSGQAARNGSEHRLRQEAEEMKITDEEEKSILHRDRRKQTNWLYPAPREST